MKNNKNFRESLFDFLDIRITVKKERITVIDCCKFCHQHRIYDINNISSFIINYIQERKERLLQQNVFIIIVFDENSVIMFFV